MECNGVRLHYVERGNPAAPPVVLFHGNGTMIQDLTISGMVDELAKDYRVICFDRPGFGYSTRPRSQLWTPELQAKLFATALKELSVEEPVVFGHSWGASVPLALSLHKPHSVRALILASGYYFPTLRLDFWLLSGPALPILGDFLRYTVAPLLSLFLLPGIFHKLFAPRAVPAEFKRNFPSSLCLRPKQLRAAAEESALLIPAATRLQFQYAMLTCPVRLIHGDSDRLIETAQAISLHSAIRQSNLQLFKAAGTWSTTQIWMVW
jgi:pimeloyl-ACP methyl ester carboxylesterase